MTEFMRQVKIDLEGQHVGVRLANGRKYVGRWSPDTGYAMKIERDDLPPIFINPDYVAAVDQHIEPVEADQAEGE